MPTEETSDGQNIKSQFEGGEITLVLKKMEGQMLEKFVSAFRLFYRTARKSGTELILCEKDGTKKHFPVSGHEPDYFYFFGIQDASELRWNALPRDAIRED